MTAALILVGVLAVLAVVYRVRCALDPFTSRGRRRGYYWARGWRKGQNASNRDDRWT